MPLWYCQCDGRLQGAFSELLGPVGSPMSQMLEMVQHWIWNGNLVHRGTTWNCLQWYWACKIRLMLLWLLTQSFVCQLDAQNFSLCYLQLYATAFLGDQWTLICLFIYFVLFTQGSPISSSYTVILGAPAFNIKHTNTIHKYTEHKKYITPAF